MKALIIVDMQYDFLPGGSLAVNDGDKIIERINKLQEKYDVVVATQDWHPANHKSFASQHTDKQPFDVIELGGNRQVLWPDHCVQGTKGAEIHKDIKQNKISAIIRKGMNPEVDSYSAFFDVNKKNPTGLNGFLKDHNVTSVYICGLAADYCVYYTAKDALELGYTTYILEGTTKAINQELFDELKEDFIKKGGNVSTYLL
ncbi:MULTISPECIES: bifunctional nicotinamidase/pyrazinamidase [Empedobacter]|uniref:bifunctional nicotinamidase/pyrazinamidase n=1 Tax=Empedobacter TaxID=59734 RepID=UPI000E91F647|nr:MULTISPECIES: bifunctional nicotinamidase/pyrazinamidase [Empedobacter]MBY0065469.1 bifunctional nicotinamidase/pyrazinamidase [Empedobacter falsenii]MDM1137896.1 bifunctional nicotinamidase/pyrazinamidase [Empedobacter sp. R132-2]HBX61603.1 bifunctional nicotinamidase/pyrazinamidase [Flavobacteriaceae bacterium]